MEQKSDKIVSIASDHAGIELRAYVRELLTELGLAVIDNGTNSPESVDYPDFAHFVADDILQKRADCGVLICGTGIGISIAANRFKGIRAALCTSVFHAVMSRRHNNANVLALGARFTHPEDARAMLMAFLNTEFEGGRHERRIGKMDKMESMLKEKE